MKIQISFEFRKIGYEKYRSIFSLKKSDLKDQTIFFFLEKLDLKDQISFWFRKIKSERSDQFFLVF